jgi:hypothetical protein
MSNLATFAHKIINNDNAPLALRALLKPKQTSEHTERELRTKIQNPLTRKMEIINTRHKNAIAQPKSFSKAGDSTFSHFFASFVTNLVVEDIHQRFSFFKTIIFNNINLLFLKFVDFFPKFDLINKNFDYLLKKKNEKL